MRTPLRWCLSVAFSMYWTLLNMKIMARSERTCELTRTPYWYAWFTRRRACRTHWRTSSILNNEKKCRSSTEYCGGLLFCFISTCAHIHRGQRIRLISAGDKWWYCWRFCGFTIYFRFFFSAIAVSGWHRQLYEENLPTASPNHEHKFISNANIEIRRKIWLKNYYCLKT